MANQLGVGDCDGVAEVTRDLLSVSLASTGQRTQASIIASWPPGRSRGCRSNEVLRHSYAFGRGIVLLNGVLLGSFLFVSALECSR